MTRHAGYSLTYRYKKHWTNYAPPDNLVWYAVCRKHLPQWAFADTIAEITCKTCQRRFAYWNQEDPQ